MCGRYSFAPTPKQKARQLDDLKQPVVWKIRFNLAPTQSAYVIANDDPQQIKEMNWGLVPSWSRDGVNSGKMINARAETIFEKPSFREVIHSRRCLVPADSFYEWRKEPDGRKLPYRIFLKNGNLLFMAGVWDRWGSGATAQSTFSILTTGPNEEMATLHNRMPLILATKEEQQKWLSDLPEDEIANMMVPAADHLLQMYRVSERLNGTAYDGPDLQEEVADTLRLF
ncbi:MAG TPA: SOS response-associated peptidase [Saprospiraceae bacterium]|nr:SOS response-associated peptidase [Saprospiraceae bacterium]HPI07692.1 SOS response-associated peptidase [Saprospiraceae bacterium]